MILEKIERTKRDFNVNRKADVELFKQFLIEGRWGANGCPFALEYPYLSVPDMIKDKLVHKYLNISLV